jgi:hypothetical protein
MASSATSLFVVPAKAGTQLLAIASNLAPGLRRGDSEGFAESLP